MVGGGHGGGVPARWHRARPRESPVDEPCEEDAVRNAAGTLELGARWAGPRPDGAVEVGIGRLEDQGEPAESFERPGLSDRRLHQRGSSTTLHPDCGMCAGG